MKVRKMLGIDRELFERLQAVCEKEGYMRSTFINHMLRQELDTVNSFGIKDEKLSRKGKKVKFQINVDEEIYNAIIPKKAQRIERILEIVIADYENGNPRY